MYTVAGITFYDESDSDEDIAWLKWRGFCFELFEGNFLLCHIYPFAM